MGPEGRQLLCGPPLWRSSGSPAILVLEAPLLPNKQLDGINVPLLVALVDAESFFKQHPDGFRAIRMRGTHQPGQQKEAGQRLSRSYSDVELCKPILQCLNHGQMLLTLVFKCVDLVDLILTSSSRSAILALAPFKAIFKDPHLYLSITH
eukprot:XP_001708189.1 Hypothetical protein GL50803_31911 [Giardia lamblia ATCC 50803]